MAKEVVPNPELRKIGLEFYKGPFRFDHLGGYIWAKGDPSTHGSQMFADLDQATERCARIRGWGALQYLKDVDCGALQDEIGVMFAEAITEYWDRAKNTLVVVLPPLGVETPEFAAFKQWFLDNMSSGDSMTVHSPLDFERVANIGGPGEAVHAPNAGNVIVSYDLQLHAQGINTTLLEGDSITLQQGRIFIQRKQQN